MIWPEQRIPGGLESWPALLRPAVKELGPSVVWRVGGYTLQYPPTWINDVAELRVVLESLESEEVKRMLLDASEYKSVDELTGNAPPLAGRYHAIIKTVDEVKYPDKIAVSFEVLKGTTPGQEGRGFVEFFSLSDKARPRLLLFCVASGLMKVGQRADVSITAAEGRQMIIEVELKPYEGKTYARLTYRGMWSLDNPEATDVPRAHDMEKYADATLTESAAALTATAAAPAAAKAPASDDPGQPDDPWANL